MPAIRKGYRRPGRVVLPRRLPVSPGRDGCHRGGQCPAKRWCARRTLKNNRLRMCVGAPCAPGDFADLVAGFCRADPKWAAMRMVVNVTAKVQQKGPPTRVLGA